MKFRRNHKLSSILFLLLFIALIGCSNNQENEIKNAESDDGYKPVIMYNDTLYWLSVEKSSNQLQEGYVDSQKRIESCLKDAMQLPKEELVTSAKFCDGVGRRIFVNEGDDSKIVIATETDSYQLFEKDQGVK